MTTIELVDKATKLFKDLAASTAEFQKLKIGLEDGSLKFEEWEPEMTRLEEEMLGYFKILDELDAELDE